MTSPAQVRGNMQLMNIAMRVATRSFRLTIAALLSVAAAGAFAANSPAPASAAQAVANQQPVEEVQELDQIWVRGKRLSRSIADAEDDFFKLYNKLNKGRDYDVTCGYVQLQRGSMIMNRTCQPAYLAYYYAPIITFGGFAGCDSGYIPPAGADPYGVTYTGGCTGRGFRHGGIGPSVQSIGTQSGMSPETKTRRSQEYYRTVMRTIYSDQRLLDKAETLATMYTEMATVQNNYRKVKAVDTAGAQVRKVKPHTPLSSTPGPR